MKLLSYLAFVACLEAAVFAVVVYSLNPQALLNRLGAVLGLLNAWWTGCLVFVYGADSGTALVFDKLSYFAVLGLPPLLSWFYLTMAAAPRAMTASVFGVTTVAALAVASAYLVGGFPHSAFVDGPWGRVALEARGLWTVTSEAVAIATDVVCFVYLFLLRRTTSSWRLKRLLTFVLVGMVLAVVAYAVLGWLSSLFSLPPLIFLPAALILAVHFYVIAQYRFLQSDSASWEKGWADVVPRPAFFFDATGKMVGHNRQAQSLAGESWLEGLPALWSTTEPTEVETPRGPVRVSPHFDRFGDFIGAVAVPQGSANEETLSPRENEVLGLVLEGQGNQAIADRLFISRDTVKRHVHAILAKTKTGSRRELILRFGGR